MTWTILHVTEAWNAGVGVYVDRLIRQQAADPRISAIHLACSSSRTPAQVNYDLLQKVRVHRYESSRSLRGLPRAGRAIQRLVQQVRPTLVHAHSTFSGVYCRVHALGCPLVYCAHGWPFTQELNLPRRLLYGAAEAVMARRSQALVHISQDEFRRAARFRISAPLNRVIRNGVRAPVVLPEPVLSIDPHKVNIGFVGRLDRQKGVDVLLAALRAVTRRDVHLYVIGDYDRESPQNKPSSEPDARVTSLGWVEQDRLDSYLQLFDVVVVPSRWEAFGLVASEAMRNGKPVIVSDRGGLPEQVIHGFNGFVFSFDEPSSLVSLLQQLDKPRLAAMGANARRVWQECFKEERAYQDLMKVYAEVLERTAPGGTPAGARLLERARN
jgi:glycosyltransferase involved in cell wall biosynthesis